MIYIILINMFKNFNFQCKNDKINVH